MRNATLTGQGRKLWHIHGGNNFAAIYFDHRQLLLGFAWEHEHRSHPLMSHITETRAWICFFPGFVLKLDFFRMRGDA